MRNKIMTVNGYVQCGLAVWDAFHGNLLWACCMLACAVVSFTAAAMVVE